MSSERPELYKNMPRIVLETLRAELKDMFKVYYYGDPLFIGNSWLPCLILDLESIEPSQRAPTRHDRWRNSMVIKIIVDKMSSAGLQGTEGGRSSIIEVPTKTKMEQMIFARDATTKQYIDKSVMGVLRRNFTMNGAEIDQSVTVRFGTSVRPMFGDDNLDKQPIITAEAQIFVDGSELIQVPDRK